MLIPRNTANEILHLVGAFTLHAVGHMTIDIQREGGGGMPEVVLYRFDIDAGTDRGYGIAVPQIMVTGIRATDGGHRFLIPVEPL